MKYAVLLALVLAICSLVAVNGPTVGGSSEQTYIGNVRSCVFHRQTCHYLPKVRNRVCFDARSKAIDAGYRPCRKCRP